MTPLTDERAALIADLRAWITDWGGSIPQADELFERCISALETAPPIPPPASLVEATRAMVEWWRSGSTGNFLPHIRAVESALTAHPAADELEKAATAYREAVTAHHEASMTRIIGDEASTAHAFALAAAVNECAAELLSIARGDKS